MKQLSMYIFAAFFLYGCNGNDTSTAETGLITYDELDADDTATGTTQQQTIVAYASDTPQLSTFQQALQAANLDQTLEAGGPYTVFAPSNEAFDALPEGTLDELLKPENQEQLRNILAYHITSGDVMVADFANSMAVNTLSDNDVQVERQGDQMKVNDANVTQPNIDVSNGVVHVIDKVLMPPSN